ncbi:MAG: flagellar basal body rod protein FlgB [Firmicutes bacterium]|nr:flagellar basal body rod protein FlgB [Bacillota bacterium]
MKILSDPTNNILAKQMDACTMRQRVIANNIANANTPGFKKSTVNFQQQLRAALECGGFRMKTSDPRHIARGQGGLDDLAAEVSRVEDTSMRAGENNVDIDQEMVDLAANTLLYRLATRVRSDRSSIMNNIVKGGR